MRPGPIAPEPSAAPTAVATADSPLALGTHHPYRVIDADHDERWAVVCQAREDTNHDGVFFAARSYFPNDLLRPYLMRGEGPGEPIDQYLGAELSGRYVAFRRERSLRVLDITTGQEHDLDPAHEADPGPDVDGPALTPRISFGPGMALLPVRSATRPEHALVVVVDLATGQRRRLDLGEGRLRSVAIDQTGAWMRARIATRDTDPGSAIERTRQKSALLSARRSPADVLADREPPMTPPLEANPGPDPCAHVANEEMSPSSWDASREARLGYRTVWFRAGEAVPVAPPTEPQVFRDHALKTDLLGEWTSAQGRTLLPFDEQISAHEWLTGVLTDVALEQTHGGRSSLPRGPFHWARPGAPSQRLQQLTSPGSQVIPGHERVDAWRDDPSAPCVVYSPMTVSAEPLPARFSAPLAEEDDSRRYGSHGSFSAREPGELMRPEDAPPQAYVRHQLQQLDPKMIERVRQLMKATASTDQNRTGGAVPYHPSCEVLARLLEGGVPEVYREDAWRSLSGCDGARFDQLFRRADVPEQVRSSRLEHVAQRVTPDPEHCAQFGIEPRRCRSPVPTLWSRRPEHRAARLAEGIRCVGDADLQLAISCLESLASLDWKLARAQLPRLPASESREEAVRLLTLFPTREEYEARLRALALGGPRSGDANDWLLTDRVPGGELAWVARQDVSVRFWDDIEQNLYQLASYPGSPLEGVAALEPRGPRFDGRPAMVAYVGGERFAASLEQLAEGLLTTANTEAEPELLVQQAFVGFVNSIARHRGSRQRYVQLRGGWRVVQVSEALACEIRSLGLRKSSYIHSSN